VDIPHFLCIRRIKNMRLDKFLKVSRIIKRRTVAKEACDKGIVTINGKIAKSSSEVSIGDILEIKFGEKLMKFEIKEIKEHVLKNDAKEMFEIIE
jgi:ribosomal 50S subunit-recycling heat shock protein